MMSRREFPITVDAREDGSYLVRDTGGTPRFTLVRRIEPKTTNGGGLWEVRRLVEGQPAQLVDEQPYLNDALENIKHGYYPYNLPPVVNGWLVIEVPRDAGDFYISGSGFLCARAPVHNVMLDTPVTDFGVVSNSQILGMASIEHLRLAGLPDTASAVLLRRRKN